MNATKLHWLNGPWPGRLALAARPRGGDWLGDEISTWHSSGVDTIVSLLTRAEEQDLDLANESRAAKEEGLTFFPFPFPTDKCPLLRMT